MHYADINAALIKSGQNQIKVAHALVPPVHKSLVGRVIRGEKRSQRVEKAISEAAGLSLWRLWPQWYSKPRRRTA